MSRIGINQWEGKYNDFFENFQYAAKMRILDYFYVEKIVAKHHGIIFISPNEFKARNTFQKSEKKNNRKTKYGGGK